MGIFEILNVMLVGWFVGFMTFCFIEIFTGMRRMKKEQVRHDLEMARIKAARSVRG